MGRHRALGALFLTSSDAWLNGSCEYRLAVGNDRAFRGALKV
jgi:hypothetical protein